MAFILKFLRPILLFSHKHPKFVVSLCLAIAVWSSFYAVQLKIDTDIANLLPEDYPSVQALNVLKETIGGETFIDVAIYSPDFESNKRFAEDFIERALKLEDTKRGGTFVTRVEYIKDVKVLEDNALYFATVGELVELTGFLEDRIEDAKLEANPFYFDLDDEEEDDESGDDERLQSFRDNYEKIVPTEYPISSDSTVMVLKFVPAGPKSNMGFLHDMFGGFDELIAELDPSTYHPEMVVKAGGRLQKYMLDLESIVKDVQNSFGSGISAVVLLVMVYFFMKKFNTNRFSHGKRRSFLRLLLRTPVPILVIGFPLLISLSWTFGLAYLFLGILNTMTSVLFVILFGMGIDYGIHYYARYLEKRAIGLGVTEAIQETYDSTGESIFTSAFTTSISLFVLMFADFRGFSEFGMIAGGGILLSLFAMIFVLPAFVTLFEKWRWIEIIEVSEDADRKILTVQPHRFPWSKTILGFGFSAILFVALNTDGLRFEYDFGKLEQRHSEYEDFRSVARQIDDSNSERRNPAYIIFDNDYEVKPLVEALNKKIKEDTLSPTILTFEALQERFPEKKEDADVKLSLITKVRALLNDPFLRDQDDKDLRRLRKAASTQRALSVDEMPEYLKNTFVTKSGEVGKFIIIYPSVRLADGRNSIEFKNDIAKVETKDGSVYYAASTSLVAAEMLDLMRTESPYMVSATFLLIIILMLFTFRSVRWAIISLLPLVVGLVLTFAIMIVFDFRFNFYNLVVLPAILGIGEDSGVHLAHRYLEEGKGSMWAVLSSTGQHVSIGSITTMLGFSGLIFTQHPGLISIGVMATLGIGMTLLTSLVFLPALVQFLEDRNWIKFPKPEEVSHWE